MLHIFFDKFEPTENHDILKKTQYAKRQFSNE